MAKKIKYIILAVLLLLTVNISANDELFPNGFNFFSTYDIGEPLIRANDTFTIIRTFKNDESFPVTGLYFSDNIPPETYFDLIQNSVSVNGTAIEYLFYKEHNNPILENLDAYYCVIDSPKEYDNISNTILPGDSVHFELKLIPREMGYFLFPRHTLVFYGDSSGFFTTADSVYVDIQYACGNVNGLSVVNILDITYLIQYLYLGGEEPLPNEAGDANGNGIVNLLDITYLIFFLYRNGPDPICP